MYTYTGGKKVEYILHRFSQFSTNDNFYGGFSRITTMLQLNAVKQR